MSRVNLIAGVVLTGLALAAIFAGNGYQLFVLSLVGLTAIVGIGLNILVGMSGQISLGHVGFYAIGAYTVAILTVDHGVSFWIALPLAGIVAGIAGGLLSIPALRVRGPYLAMVTIAFGFIVEQSAAELDGLTGGWNGIMGISTPSLPGLRFGQQEIAVLVLVLVIVALVFYARFSASPWGKALRALRDSEVAAQSIGLNPILLRCAAFALSAVFAGVAGGVYAAMSGFISPESFPFFESILFLLVVMIGGADTVLGPVIGALVVVLLPELFASLAEYRLLFVGLLLLVVLRVAPRGMVGAAMGLLRRGRTAPVTAAPREAGELLSRETGGALQVEGLSISFGGVRAVQDLSFRAEPGKITSIIGPNGAGKTTALNLVAGYYRPDAGSVRLGGTDLTGRRSHRVARAGIARTYQTTQLFEHMSVLDNLLIAMPRGAIEPGAVVTALQSGERRRRAEELLAFVGYRGDLALAAGNLPHVDKRLVEIARALAFEPEVVLLDEPAAGLGEEDTAHLGELLKRLSASGITIVLIEHDMGLVMGISDHVLVLDSGEKIAEGPPAAVREDPVVLKAYLGEGASGLAGRARKGERSQETALVVEGLTASYGASEVLLGLDLEVMRGELVAVLGANGAGKSTLMRALSGLHRPIGGRVSLDGESLETIAADRIARRGLVLVPEGRQVFPELTVVQNIRLGTYGRPPDDLSAEVERLLDRFPRLRERKGQRAGLLSGGEQQMLAIARGLVARPKVLLLDEPSLGLAPALIEELYAILAGLRDDGATILLVDQMAEMALGIADRAYVLSSGAIVAGGTPEEVRESRLLEEAYLGDARAAS